VVSAVVFNFARNQSSTFVPVSNQSRGDLRN